LTYSSPRPFKLPTKAARLRAESKALWNEARSIAEANFFTLGYAGRTIQQVIDLLRGASVRSLLDVRYNPVSMYKPDFSKSNLQRSVADAGMVYHHIRELGVPRDVRATAAGEGSREPIWKWYDCCVVDSYFSRNLHWFMNLEHPVAMMCMEQDPTECHRHRIFLALERQGLQGFDL
jgi:uncharacterized protein (DUF488 family)